MRDLVGQPPTFPSARRPPTLDQGAMLWDFLTSFVAARRTFLSIYRLYERRVLHAARATGVSREVLVLPPRELFGLFHLRRLELLRDHRLGPLRTLAQRIFGDQAHEELLDVYCSHIFHEFSILSEEHRSVGRFLRIHDRRRYRQLFEEVSGYYPMRLRRIRRLFTGGLRRIETLLPRWASHRVIVRSVYLFGDRIARQAYGQGVETLYRRMYPGTGEIVGFQEAAASFQASGFVVKAREAAERAVAVGEAERSRRVLADPEAHAFAAARALLDAAQAAPVPAPAGGAP